MLGNECRNHPIVLTDHRPSETKHFDDRLASDSHIGHPGSVYRRAFERAERIWGATATRNQLLGYSGLRKIYIRQRRYTLHEKYPLTTYMVMAMIVITASQPSTYARING
eukprot:257757-Pleurochrysis_carterae.AAC.2